MLYQSLKFGIRLLAWLVVVFSIHELVLFALRKPPFEDLILHAYLANYILVLLTFYLILFFKNKKSQSLGFFYLGGFFLKLIAFLVYFNPEYKADALISPFEFFAFFTPYSFCLIYETAVIVKILNKE